MWASTMPTAARRKRPGRKPCSPTARSPATAAAVAGLGIMSPAAHACGVGNQSTGSDLVVAGAPAYAGGGPLAGYAGVQGSNPGVASGYVQVSGGTAAGSGTAEANGLAGGTPGSSSVTVDGSGP